MKIGTTCCLLLFTLNFSFANVWKGDYFIHSQENIDAFPGICGCTVIDGSLIITGNDIVNLNSLSVITEIEGRLILKDNPLLNDLSGLNNIEKIEKGLFIENNSGLTEIAGFEKLQNVPMFYLTIEYNESLTKIADFKNILNAAYIKIHSNPNLKEFTLFEKLGSIGQLIITSNESLATIKELDVIKEINIFSIHSNDKLERIEGFNEVTVAGTFRISGGQSLTTIDAFKKLERATSFSINIYNQLSIFNGFELLEEVEDNFEVMFPESMINTNNFKSLRKVEKYFNSNIAHFEQLDSIGLLHVSYDVGNIDTLTGPSGLKKIGRLDVLSNNLLRCINGFPSLEQVYSIIISNNSNLSKIEGFNQLNFVGTKDTTLNSYDYYSYEFLPSISIYDNPELQVIDGFESLKKLNGSLTISSNSNLTSISAFDGLETITAGCTLDLPTVFSDQDILKKLKNIEGTLRTSLVEFNQLEYVGHLNMWDLAGLSDTLIGFSTLKNAGTIIIGKSPIIHIAAFPNLKTASLRFIRNENLVSIGGFEDIDTIHTFEVEGNPSLVTFTGMENLRFITDKFDIYDNSALENIDHFNKLTKINGRLAIFENESLSTISGFRNLKFANNISITNSQNLHKISTFSNLSQVNERLTINRNPSLIQIDGFNHLLSTQIISINNNTNLQKMIGFEMLKNTETIYITSNNNLLSIEGFHQLSNLPVLSIENRNLRKLDAFTQLKVLNELNLTDNIQLRSIDNFSSVGIINHQLLLNNNIQLNNCCLVNCWLKNGVVNESRIDISDNGMSCSHLGFIKNNCQEKNCPVNDQTFSDLTINNPVATQLQFSFIIFEEQTINYTIYNINEQVIRKGAVAGNKGFNSKTIDLPDAERGFYFLQIEDGEFEEIAKFLKL